MTFKLILDSTADLPEEMLIKHDIDIVPLTILIDGKEYTDKDSIKTKEVFEAMRNGLTPKTSQATPQRFYHAFEKYLRQGQDILYISLPSKLSGTNQAAHIVRNELVDKYPDRKIIIIDGKSAATGLGLLALKAVKMREQGIAIEDISTSIEESVGNLEHIFTLDSLEWLQKGGRLSKSQAFVGDMLKIKPLLRLIDGQIQQYKKIRSKKKAFRAIAEDVKNRIGSYTDQIIGISHGDEEEVALEMKALLEEIAGVKEFMICPIGATLGTHLGVGCIGVIYFNEDER